MYTHQCSTLVRASSRHVICWSSVFLGLMHTVQVVCLALLNVTSHLGVLRPLKWMNVPRYIYFFFPRMLLSRPSKWFSFFLPLNAYMCKDTNSRLTWRGKKSQTPLKVAFLVPSVHEAYKVLQSRLCNIQQRLQSVVPMSVWCAYSIYSGKVRNS